MWFVSIKPCLWLHQARTIFVNGEGHVRGDDLIVADLAELERAVSVHCLHFQDAVILLPLKDGGFVGLLLECWRVLVDIVYLDVHSGPDGGKYSDVTVNVDGLMNAKGFIFVNYQLVEALNLTHSWPPTRVDVTSLIVNTTIHANTKFWSTRAWCPLARTVTLLCFIKILNEWRHM